MQLWQGLSVTILFIINRLRESYGSLFLFEKNIKNSAKNSSCAIL